ncbi:hypothetical protein [Vibrio ostreicida]|uniref:hypothetical protein n=1 Tax=Vibrio ostreicida TaxID=526588 RepID=UPI000970ADF0|nr:hypothetical protein [Vibrio ostreicida]
MYIEPWNDIANYPNSYRTAVGAELDREIGCGHVLNKLNFELLAKRDDCDDVLLSSKDRYFIVHLTWSGKAEKKPYPKTDVFDSREELDNKLRLDAKLF